MTENETALISLPSNLFTSLEQPTIGIVSTLYATPTLFPLRDNGTRKRGVVSPVLGTTVGSGLRFANLTPPVQIQLRLTELSANEVNPLILMETSGLPSPAESPCAWLRDLCLLGLSSC